MYATAFCLTIVGGILGLHFEVWVPAGIVLALAATALLFGVAFSYRAWQRRRRGESLGRSPSWWS